MATTSPNYLLGKYVKWPAYPGFSTWSLTDLETSEQVPGSGDNRIDSKMIPSNQFATRYNPFSNEIPLSAWVPPSGLPSSWLAHTGYTSGASLSASYLMWLQNGEQDCAMFQLFSSTDVQRFGLLPPTFDYSIGDTIKECVHYGIEANFFMFIEMTGIVWFISLDSFYAYPEYIARCRYKGFRMYSGGITSAFYVSGRGTSIWTYKLSTTLKNDKSGVIDLSSDSVTMQIYKVKTDGTFDVLDPGTYNVLSIDGPNVTFTGPPPQDQSKDYPDGWVGGYFTFNKYVLINNPLLLYTDRSVTDSPNIPGNNFVIETSLGYETRAQQMEKGGTVSGVYVSKSSIVDYLNKKIADATTPPAVVTQATQDRDSINNNTYPVLEPEGMIYGDLSTPFGKRLLTYLKELGATTITLYAGIGGGTTRYHNMHAGCLSGDYVVHSTTNSTVDPPVTTTDTYRISNQLRRSIFQFGTVSKTSTGNLLDQLIALSDPTTYAMTVGISRCWFFNDITYSTNDSSLNEAMFWGHLTSAGVPIPTPSPVTSNVTLQIDSGFWIYDQRSNLVSRFTQSVTPSIPGTTLVKKWDDQKGWKLNRYGGQSYTIISMTPSASDAQSYDIVIDADLSNVILSSTDKWWISFDALVPLMGNYNYISNPTFEMQGALANSNNTGLRYDSLVLDGIYVSNPFKLPVPGDAVISVAMETGGIYPNTTVPPPVYISTARKGGTIGLGRNKQWDSRRLLYQKDDDPLLYLMVRNGNMNFGYGVEEKFVFYGDVRSAAAAVTGSAGSTLTINLGANSSTDNVVGFKCKRQSQVGAAGVNGSYPFVTWSVYHGSYFLQYKSTSEVVSTIYTSRFGTHAEEANTVFNFYLPGNIVSRDFSKYYIAINTESPNSNVVDKTKLNLVPSYNNSLSPLISDVSVYYIPYQNMVKNCSSPYCYDYNGKNDIILFVKNQTWMNGESATASSIGNCTLVKSGPRTDPALTLTIPPTSGSRSVTLGTAQIKSLFDPQQEGLFIMSTGDNFKSYNSALFTRPSWWKDADQPSPTEPGQKITDISTVTTDNLYKIPHLLVENITRCSYSEETYWVDIVGFTNLKESAASTNNVLCLVFYRINVLEIDKYSVYAIYGSSNKPVFTYSNCPKGYKRLLVQKAAYEPYLEDSPAILTPESNLVTSPVYVASDNKSLIVVLHLQGGMVYLISSDGGKSWAYFDDIKLVSNPASSVSSPSCKIIEDQLYLFYLLNNSDLYLKLIPMVKLVGLSAYCQGVKSSSVQDSSFTALKSSLQTYLNNSCYTKFVGQINDQQVACNFCNTKDFHVVYQNVSGKVAAISTTNLGKSWNYKPVNF